MKLGVLFGMMMIALLDVVRSHYAMCLGADAKESLEYVLLVSSSLLILFHAFPDWE